MLRRMLVLWALALFIQALGDRSPPSWLAPAPATGGGVRLAKLWRVSARAHGDGPLTDEAPQYYVGRATIGTAQQDMVVSFDTSLGMIILPSSECGSDACLEHRRYSRAQSRTSVDMNLNGTLVNEGRRLSEPGMRRDTLSIGISSMDLGDGKVAGELVHDSVCLGSARDGQQSCTRLGLLAVTDASAVPFRAMPHDGLIGLGLDALSVNPLFNFLKRSSVATPGMESKFSLFFGANTGEIAFGGMNPARLASPLAWNPVVHSEQGYWQLQIKSIRIGNRSLSACESGTCRGIIDSCASRIGVPANILPDLKTELGSASAHLPSDSIGCGGTGDPLHIELESGTLTLSPEDYRGGAACEPRLTPLELPEQFAGVFVLGEPVLRRYYSVFDWDTQSVGFGLAAVASEEESEETVDQYFEVDTEALLVSRAQGVLVMLFAALAMQVVVVVVLSMANPSGEARKQVLLRLQLALVHFGLAAPKSSPITLLPADEVVEGCECVVCLGTKDEDAEGGHPGRLQWCRLSCGHRFHEQCVYEWLWKVPQCPVCRSHLEFSSNTTWQFKRGAVAA